MELIYFNNNLWSWIQLIWTKGNYCNLNFLIIFNQSIRTDKRLRGKGEPLNTLRVLYVD
jgi:hypothetical protein